jgi:hypothetical protein
MIRMNGSYSIRGFSDTAFGANAASEYTFYKLSPNYRANISSALTTGQMSAVLNSHFRAEILIQI